MRYLKQSFIAYWTPRRIKGLVAGCVLLVPLCVLESEATDSIRHALEAVRIGLPYWLPLLSIPALAALALFDWREGKRSDLQERSALHIAFALAVSCLLPLLAIEACCLLYRTGVLWMISASTIGPFREWEIAVSKGAIDGTSGSPTFLPPMMALEGSLQDIAGTGVTILAWLVLFGACLMVAGTSKTIRSAVVRSYIYGWALALIPSALCDGLVDAVRDWERNAPPLITPGFASTSPVHPELITWCEILIRYVVWAASVEIIVCLLRRGGSLVMKAFHPTS